MLPLRPTMRGALFRRLTCNDDVLDDGQLLGQALQGGGVQRSAVARRLLQSSALLRPRTACLDRAQLIFHELTQRIGEPGRVRVMLAPGTALGTRL